MARMKVGPGGGRHLFLVRQARVREAHLLRHRLGEHVLERGEGLPGRVAPPGHPADLHRPEQVEAGGDLGVRHRRDRHERRERDHGPAGPAADVHVSDVRGLAAVVGLGLDVDAEEAAEPVEVVDVAAAEHRRHRLEHLVDGHAERARLLAVELHLHLGIVRVEGREEIGQLGPLARLREELARLGPELLHRERAAPVLEQELEPRRCAEPRDGRDVEREDDRLGDLRELRLQAGHDRLDVQGGVLALLPGLEANEDGPEVRLVGARDDAIAADRREGVDAGGLGDDLLDLGEHGTRALEGRSGRELDVDAVKPLVLVRDESRRERAAEEAGADGHRGDEQDRHHRPAHEQMGDPDVAVGRPVEHPVEPAEEGPERAPPRPVGGLEEHRAQRRRERERAEGREQHRDGDGQGELLVHPPGEAAEEGDGDEDGGQDEGDAR